MALYRHSEAVIDVYNNWNIEWWAIVNGNRSLRSDFERLNIFFADDDERLYCLTNDIDRVSLRNWPVVLVVVSELYFQQSGEAAATARLKFNWNREDLIRMKCKIFIPHNEGIRLTGTSFKSNWAKG